MEIENLEDEQLERMSKSPQKEIPKVAKELYPRDKDKQESFIKDIQDTQAEFERILASPEDEIPKIAQERYPDDTEKQNEFIKEMESLIDIISSNQT